MTSGTSSTPMSRRRMSRNPRRYFTNYRCMYVYMMHMELHVYSTLPSSNAKDTAFATFQGLNTNDTASPASAQPLPKPTDQQKNNKPKRPGQQRTETTSQIPLWRSPHVNRLPYLIPASRPEGWVPDAYISAPDDEQSRIRTSFCTLGLVQSEGELRDTVLLDDGATNHIFNSIDHEPIIASTTLATVEGYGKARVMVTTNTGRKAGTHARRCLVCTYIQGHPSVTCDSSREGCPPLHQKTVELVYDNWHLCKVTLRGCHYVLEDSCSLWLNSTSCLKVLSSVVSSALPWKDLDWNGRKVCFVCLNDSVGSIV